MEIGGFDIKQTFQNPPVSFLLQELEKTTDFTLSYASILPELKVESFNKTDLGGGLYRIEITVGNSGYLPTYISDKGRSIKETAGVEILIEGQDEMIEGKEKTVIEELSSFTKTATGNHFYGNITTGNSESIRKKVSWVIRKKDGEKIKISIKSKKAGNISISV